MILSVIPLSLTRIEVKYMLPYSHDDILSTDTLLNIGPITPDLLFELLKN